jgi:hypothetical protein
METKLHILAISAQNHADILTNPSLDYIRELIVDLQLLKLHHTTDQSIIYIGNGNALDGLQIMVIVCRLELSGIDYKLLTVTI